MWAWLAEPEVWLAGHGLAGWVCGPAGWAGVLVSLACLAGPWASQGDTHGRIDVQMDGKHLHSAQKGNVAYSGI